MDSGIIVGDVSAEVQALTSEGVNDAPTENADRTLASSEDQEEGVTHGASQDVSEAAAHHSAPSGGEVSAEQDAVKKTTSFKRIRNKSKKSADGESKKSDFFSKLLKKFKRPVGPAVEKAEAEAEVEEEEEVKAIEPAVEASTSEVTEEMDDAAPKPSLDPSTDPNTEFVPQVINEPAAQVAVDLVEHTEPIVLAEPVEPSEPVEATK